MNILTSVNDCLLWWDPMLEQDKTWAIETIHHEMTIAPISHPCAMLGGKRQESKEQNWPWKERKMERSRFYFWDCLLSCHHFNCQGITLISQVESVACMTIISARCPCSYPDPRVCHLIFSLCSVEEKDWGSRLKDTCQPAKFNPLHLRNQHRKGCLPF